MMKTIRLLSVFLLVLLVLVTGYPPLPAALASPPLHPSSPDVLTVISVTQSPTDPRQLTITGAEFSETPVPTVLLGTTALLNVVWENDTALTATVPATIPSGTYTLKVINPGTLEEATLDQYFTFPPPTISGVAQAPENLRLLTISGDHFADGSTVLLGTTMLENITFVNAQTLTASVPVTLSSGTYELKVTNPDFQEGILTAQYYGFEPPGPAPVITNVVQQPTNLRVLSITGQNFVATLTVFFDQTPLEDVQLVDAQMLLATVPVSVTSGTYTLKVVNPDTQEDTLEYDYTQPGPAPIIGRVTQLPSNLRVLSIFGENFSEDPISDVFLGETQILEISTRVLTDTLSLRATVPPEVLSGEYTLTVRNPDGQEDSLTRTFNFEQGPPSITAVVQTPGDLRQLTITGANFFNRSSVLLEDTVLTGSVYVDANTLTASVPDSFSSGAYTLTVRNPDSQEATFAVHLFFEPAPKITQVTQSTANPRLLTILGTDFVSTPTVYLGATQLQSVQLSGSTTLTAVVPANVQSGTYTLKVVNPDTQEGTIQQTFDFGQAQTEWKLFLPVTLGAPATEE